jgi:tyrosinase
MAIRKDANTLTALERSELVTAILELKSTGIYDQFVLRHANAVMSSIHSAPAFLPWHRRYIWDFEKELQRVSGNPNLGLPYWNWPEGGVDASMWNDDLLGGNGDDFSGAVTTGPFRASQWLVVNSSGQQSGPLTRTFGIQTQSIPTQAEIDQIMAITPYDSSNWNRGSNPSFRNQLEGWIGPNLHNRGHIWVGGSMLPMTSPNDPVFFMHHCMVDKLWYEWQLRFPSQSYQPTTGGPFGQNLNDPMNSTPMGTIGNRAIDVIDSNALNIEYDQLMPGTPAGNDDPVTNIGQLLQVNSAATNNNIAVAGEVDVYRFEVSNFGSFTIETSGPSDTLLSLYGPNNSNNQIAFNDDGGDNFNSLITQNLSAGTYYARVGLYNINSTGNYSIQVATSNNDPLMPELTINANPIQAAISAANESDVYRFQITNSGVYTIETNGTIDTFLSLYGPDTQTTEIASDDDSGNSLNSKINADLIPGEYFARVRHYSMFATGPYSLSVRSL